MMTSGFDKKHKTWFWVDNKLAPRSLYYMYLTKRACDLRRTCENSMLLDPWPYLALVVNQIGTRLRENPRFVVLYVSVPLCRSAIMRSLPVTAWWGAGLSFVAGVTIGLFACWVGKDWWNVIARPFPIPENLDRKWTSHCLVKFLSLFVSALPLIENWAPMILQILP